MVSEVLKKVVACKLTLNLVLIHEEHMMCLRMCAIGGKQHLSQWEVSKMFYSLLLEALCP